MYMLHSAVVQCWSRQSLTRAMMIGLHLGEERGWRRRRMLTARPGMPYVSIGRSTATPTEDMRWSRAISLRLEGREREQGST